MDTTIRFNAEGISQLFSAVDEGGKTYDYFIRRVETRETFKTLTGPITEVSIYYVAIREVDGLVSAPMTLAGAQSLVNGRCAAYSATDYVRPLGVVAPSSADLGTLLSKRDT